MQLIVIKFVFLFTFGLLSLVEGFAMGMSNPLVLFSEVHGIVLKDGKPVPGAVLMQQVVWSDNTDEVPVAHAQSGPDGRFTFATVERQSAVMRFVPHQPVILQKILIQYQGVEYMAWRHTKDSYELNSEIAGHALNLRCELSRTPDFEGTHYGICTAV